MSEIIGTDGFLERPFLEITPLPPAPTKRNRFRDAQEWLHKQRAKVSLVDVTVIEYSTQNQITTCASPAKTIFRYMDEDMISKRFVSKDFIISRDDYKFNDVLKEPQQRDRIIEQTLDAIYTYEVLAVNDEPAFKHEGTYRFAYRVHTQQIDKENI